MLVFEGLSDAWMLMLLGADADDDRLDGIEVFCGRGLDVCGAECADLVRCLQVVVGRESE